MKKTLKITGMHCKSCEILLSDVIAEAGVKVMSANHGAGEITVDLPSEAKLSEIKKAVEKEGYSLAG